MKQAKFLQKLNDIWPEDDRPVVIFSSLFRLQRRFEENPLDLVAGFNAYFNHKTQQNTILMPTFTKGYENGFLDLDKTPSTTGAITEAFRTSKDCARSCSAFFSYAVKGALQQEVLKLQPESAWGEGSLYAWLCQKNAWVLQLGLPLSQNALPHRLEWLHRDQIDYRYEKSFSGTVNWQGRQVSLQERLFVRDVAKGVETGWKHLEDKVNRDRFRSVMGFDDLLFLYPLDDLMASFEQILKNNPLAFLKTHQNSEGMRAE
ncbi:MAG: AAC(3) family N-acetyltransferase [Deltaproteobacteria bacterium]|nr:AAC(3) family N-acetyltransferase [Deltaproteobacteria bacterium]